MHDKNWYKLCANWVINISGPTLRKAKIKKIDDLWIYSIEISKAICLIVYNNRISFTQGKNMYFEYMQKIIKETND